MKAHLRIRLHRGGNGSVDASGSLTVPPYWCRWDGETLWLVGSAATPVAEDDITIELDVGPGVSATVRSVAATVVYAARGEGTQLHTHLRVAEGATLRWQPDPVIVTARAQHRSSTVIDVADGGALLADELVVLGRTDEAPGRYRASLDLRHDGVTGTRTSFDTAVPGWDGPGGTGGAKVVGTRVLVDPLDRLLPADPTTRVDERTVALRPEAGGVIATALANDPVRARALLNATADLGAG